MSNTFWGGKGVIDLPVSQVVRDIQKLDKFRHNKDMPIRLYMCRAGDWREAVRQDKICPAQQIAKEANRRVQATGAWINGENMKTYPTDTSKDLSWYEFSPDGSEPKRIPDPSDITRGGRYKGNTLGGNESRNDSRGTFDSYGSTTETAAAWEATWGLGGWLDTQRNFAR